MPIDSRVKSIGSATIKFDKHYPYGTYSSIFNDILGFRTICSDYEDFDIFYENYQSELYEKKGFSDFCKDNNIKPVRNFVYDIMPHELLNDHRINGDFNFTSRNTLDNTEISVAFRQGDRFDLGDGYYLEITENAVLAKCKNGTYDSNRMREVSDIAGALNIFIRFANGQTGSMYFDEVPQPTWHEAT